jgi:hypothetical protein
MIVVSFDVKKLDKARFFQGKKGLYCELVLIETPGGEYGDYMVKQGVTKEERAARVDMPILGNGKIIGGDKPRPQARPAAPTHETSSDDDEKIPF